MTDVSPIFESSAEKAISINIVVGFHTSLPDSPPKPILSNGKRVYGVYFNYESDASGEFTVLADTDQLNADSDDTLETVVIPNGKYLVFHAIGELPEIVINTWREIWEYFSQENTKYKHSYLTDFEHYINQNEIKVYIAVV